MIEVIESEIDRADGFITVKIDGKRRIRLDTRDVELYGIEATLKQYGHVDPRDRLDLMQRGRKVGTVPATFTGKPNNKGLVEFRRGDFTRVGDDWIADKMLGPGDLYAIDGFQPVKD